MIVINIFNRLQYRSDGRKNSKSKDAQPLWIQVPGFLFGVIGFRAPWTIKLKILFFWLQLDHDRHWRFYFRVFGYYLIKHVW